MDSSVLLLGLQPQSSVNDAAVGRFLSPEAQALVVPTGRVLHIYGAGQDGLELTDTLELQSGVQALVPVPVPGGLSGLLCVLDDDHCALLAVAREDGCVSLREAASVGLHGCTAHRLEGPRCSSALTLDGRKSLVALSACHDQIHLLTITASPQVLSSVSLSLKESALVALCPGAHAGWEKGFSVHACMQSWGECSSLLLHAPLLVGLHRQAFAQYGLHVHALELFHIPDAVASQKGVCMLAVLQTVEGQCFMCSSGNAWSCCHTCSFFPMPLMFCALCAMHSMVKQCGHHRRHHQPHRPRLQECQP